MAHDTGDYHDQVLGVAGYLKSCLKPSTYSFSAPVTPLANLALPPICVADKPKCQKQMPNVFVDDRGFPDKSKYYENLLHNVEGGPILCKLKHPPPLFDEVDPTFFCAYDKSTHGEQLQRDLDLSHLEPHVHDKVYAIVQKYWSVFNDKGIFIPVKNYKCVIDTGDAQPIATKKIIYGPNAEILGNPYSKKSPLPSIDAIGTFPSLAVSP